MEDRTGCHLGRTKIDEDQYACEFARWKVTHEKGGWIPSRKYTNRCCVPKVRTAHIVPLGVSRVRDLDSKDRALNPIPKDPLVLAGKGPLGRLMKSLCLSG